MRTLTRTLLYAVTYVVLTGAGSPWNWLVGALFGAAVAFGAWDWRRWGWGRPRLLALAWLVWGVLRLIAEGTRDMVLVLAGRRPWRHAGFVEIPAAARTEDGLVLLAYLETASPGSVATRARPESMTLEMNAIDATVPGEVRESVVGFYRRYQQDLTP